eukprot:1157711-Pelagomonas_calceolata.AAC.6
MQAKEGAVCHAPMPHAQLHPAAHTASYHGVSVVCIPGHGHERKHAHSMEVCACRHTVSQVITSYTVHGCVSWCSSTIGATSCECASILCNA